jgi:ketosteroid isomerase-like protein
MILKKQLVMVMAALALFAIVGCNGQWANSGSGSGGGQDRAQGRNRPHATEDETRQAFEKIMGAFAHKDTATINGMMSSSAIFIDPPAGPGVFTWTDAKPILEQSFARSVDFQLTNDSSYRIGVEHDLGWLATVYHIRVPADKGFSQSDGGISVLFQKTEGGYKVLMFHASRFPAQQAASEPSKSTGQAASPKKK